MIFSINRKDSLKCFKYESYKKQAERLKLLKKSELKRLNLDQMELDKWIQSLKKLDFSDIIQFYEDLFYLYFKYKEMLGEVHYQLEYQVFKIIHFRKNIAENLWKGNIKWKQRNFEEALEFYLKSRCIDHERLYHYIRDGYIRNDKIVE